MAAVNRKRIFLGALAGGVVWNLWSIGLNLAFLMKEYEAGQQAGFFLKEPRYPFFAGQWIFLLFVLSFGMASLYSECASVAAPGPRRRCNWAR